MELDQDCSNRRLWESIVEVTKSAQENDSGDPLLWSNQVSSIFRFYRVPLPSFEFASFLVSHICWDNNVPKTWKFLEKALFLNHVHPLLLLSLLSIRVIPNRHLKPAAYRIYMELLKRYAFTCKHLLNMPNYQRTRNMLDNVLSFSKIFGLKADEPGVLVVEIIFAIIWQLVDASLDDKGLLQFIPEKKSKWPTRTDDMEVDEINETKSNQLKNMNTNMAIELISGFLKNKVTSRILYLARQNMPTHWEDLLKRFQLLMKNSNPEALKSSFEELDSLMVSVPLYSFHGTNCSALWLTLDLVVEDAMDAPQVHAISAIEVLTGLVKSLKAINRSSWHDIFLGLWMASLRLVQRERDPIAGPVPHLEARLCMLLCVTVLVISDLIEEEQSARNDLISSLQSLGDYESLLIPPQTFILSANQAAAKAISGINVDTSYLTDTPIGNLRHLIVEACIARGILDTSAYLWPGYVKKEINQVTHGLSNNQVPAGWSSFMKGATLYQLMIDTLASTPASSLTELEKIYELAVRGSDQDKIVAATILCGASLSHGWNIQEHTVYFITRLLSPPIPPNYSGIESHLMVYGPMLHVLLVGISSIDYVKIFFLLGLVPQLAASLMSICEVFGSCVPNKPWILIKEEKITVHTVFSNAFALLLKLYRFDHPPIEYRVGDVPPVGSQLTPEYLLSVRNSHLIPPSENDPNKTRLSKVATSSSSEPIFVDSFPKLKVWYRQHLACIASPLSGLVKGTPVYEIVDTLLNMMFKKVKQSFSSGNSSSEDNLAAWDILEAVPFVADAALTACAHGNLSSRDLCTGLKDLADFLPASLATIVSYLSAEVTRGVWNPVKMNGTDWPSPAVNLSKVEDQIKNILAASGVDLPWLASGESSAATLPLPLAAYVSLTITYKLDKASQHFLDLAGPALESLAAGCPWPCMAIVVSLWTQKAKRWSDFLVFSASRTVFLQNKNAAIQLLRSCFNVTLGLENDSTGGIGALLGHGFGSGGISPVAPGILYLRVYRSIRDTMFLREEIVSLLVQSVSEIVNKRSKHGLKNGYFSLATCMDKVKQAALLGASLVWLTGGSGLVQSLIKETLPSWFVSVHKPELKGDSGRLRGYGLAYFVLLCGAFAWGIDSKKKCRGNIVGVHIEFLASGIDGKICIGCDETSWRAYVSGFLSMMINCAPCWVLCVDVEVLKRLSKGLERWKEFELAIALLGAGGVGTMGSAVEFIVNADF